MKKKIKKITNNLLKHKLIRFFLVGGLNTAFGYGLFALLIYSGLTYPLALLICTISGILFNFKTIGSFVFKNHNNYLLLKFLGVYVITYFLNLGCLAILQYFAVNIYLSGAILVIPIGFFAFLLNKNFVFTDSEILQ
ncbi:MAG: GtrA family protein [Paludibacter sp.]|nr:GtrA family protein [Paludibacter sp.]